MPHPSLTAGDFFVTVSFGCTPGPQQVARLPADDLAWVSQRAEEQRRARRAQPFTIRIARWAWALLPGSTWCGDACAA
jgi:hypothetical protein